VEIMSAMSAFAARLLSRSFGSQVSDEFFVFLSSQRITPAGEARCALPGVNCIDFGRNLISYRESRGTSKRFTEANHGSVKAHPAKYLWVAAHWLCCSSLARYCGR
jgi:hypothetical protein